MIKTREEWLQTAVALLTPTIEAKCGRTMPAVSVTVGWPSQGGLARKRPVIGQCWSGNCTADGSHAVFISPVLDAGGPHGALAVLVHEMLHALVGVEAKHKGPFAKAARAVGLEGKPTATFAGEELLAELGTVQGKLGEYPHAKITPAMREKPQGTRMIKMKCLACGYVARTTRKWLDGAGPLVCPCNGEAMGVEVAEGEDEPEPLPRKRVVSPRKEVEPDTEEEMKDARENPMARAPGIVEVLLGEIADEVAETDAERAERIRREDLPHHGHDDGDDEFDAEADGAIVKKRFCFGCMEDYTGRAGGCSPKCRDALAAED